MPDFYAEGEYDLSGFAVGIVKKESVINGKNIEVGDVLIGLPSSGVHSNGFSLVRRWFKNSNFLYIRLNYIFGSRVCSEITVLVPNGLLSQFWCLF